MIAKLVKMTSMILGWLYGRYNELVTGGCKPTHNWGPPCVLLFGNQTWQLQILYINRGGSIVMFD